MNSYDFIYEFLCFMNSYMNSGILEFQMSKWQKSPWKMAFQVLAVFQCCADLGSELTTNALRQKSSLICLSTSSSLPCINPQAQALIGPASVSWKSCWSVCWIWVWTIQVFLSLPLTISQCWHEATNILQLALMQ